MSFNITLLKYITCLFSINIFVYLSILIQNACIYIYYFFLNKSVVLCVYKILEKVKCPAHTNCPQTFNLPVSISQVLGCYILHQFRDGSDLATWKLNTKPHRYMAKLELRGLGYKTKKTQHPGSSVWMFAELNMESELLHTAEQEVGLLHTDWKRRMGLWCTTGPRRKA